MLKLKIPLIILVGLILCAFYAGSVNLKDKLIRVHVVANSNTKIDQALKLKVRDEILRLSGELLSGVKEKTEAEKILAENLDQAKAVALETISENGFDYDVKVSLQNEKAPESYYGSFTLPSGEYTAFRVIIGQGAGKNFWCVMFPPLCLNSAEVNLKDYHLNQKEIDLIKKGKTVYKYKSWIS